MVFFLVHVFSLFFYENFPHISLNQLIKFQCQTFTSQDIKKFVFKLCVDT